MASHDRTLLALFTFLVEGIFVCGSTLGNEMEMLYTVPVIPPPCFFLNNYASNYVDLSIIKVFLTFS